MAKALRTVGKIAGFAAIVVAPFSPGAAAILGAISAVATVGAQLLTKPPPARGSVSQVQLDPDHPSPYVMGEGYYGGVLRHRAGYGQKLKKVPNPYLWEVIAYCVAGPIAGPITPHFDFAPITSYYDDFFEYDSQLGATPEPGALVPPYGAARGWGAAHKLSGTAAIGWNYKFDREGERYASGRPVMGAYAKWVRVYDPRQDSTFPGGSGPCRLGDESTYVWDGPPGASMPAGENPALQAGTYAYGRFANGERVFGMGLPAEAIGEGFTQIAAWANDCEANDWTIFGPIFEPGDRWANLRDICIAGGGEPVPLHTGIGFIWDRPRVVLDTITEADAGMGEAQVTAQQTYRDRINRIVPEYISEAHNWELVKAEPLIVAEYVALDGETVSQTFPFNLVKKAKQAGELAAYKMVNAREFHPIVIPCKPRMRAYRPGDCLHIDRPDLGLDIDAVILNRDIDPQTMEVTLTLIGETAAKHAYALGRTAVPPPVPELGQTAEERDQLAASANNPFGLGTLKLSGSYTRGLAGNITQTNNGDGTVTVTLAAHVRVYADGTEVTVSESMITLPESTQHLLFYDDEDFVGGAISVSQTTNAGDAYFSASHPYRHHLARVTTVDAAGTGGSTGGATPPGGGGWNDNPDYNVP